jgi:hypothetical protein
VLGRIGRTTKAQFSRKFLALFSRILLCKETETSYVFNDEMNAIVNFEIFPRSQ